MATYPPLSVIRPCMALILRALLRTKTNEKRKRKQQDDTLPVSADTEPLHPLHLSAGGHARNNTSQIRQIFFLFFLGFGSLRSSTQNQHVIRQPAVVSAACSYLILHQPLMTLVCSQEPFYSNKIGAFSRLPSPPTVHTFERREA